MNRSLPVHSTSPLEASDPPRAAPRSVTSLRAVVATLALATLAGCAEAGPAPSRDHAREPRPAADVSSHALDPNARDDAPGDAEDGTAIQEGEPVTASALAATPTAELRAEIKNVSFSGKLCDPANEHEVDMSPFGFAYVSFIDAFAAAEGAPAVESCSVAIELEVPEGMQLSAPGVVWFGGNNPGVTAVQRFAWEGETPSAPVRSELSSELHLTSFPDLWSPTCSGPRRATFIASLEVRVPTHELLVLHSFTFSTEWAKGVAWRTCDGADATAPIGQLGELCGGPQAIACASGLLCQHDSNGTTHGNCVDPDEQLSPANLGESCGGARQRECVAGVACWWPTEFDAENGVLGRCVPPALSLGGECELGVPALPCEEGLYCKLKTHRCVAANGAEESECGDGLPACNEGLVCLTGTNPENGFDAGLCREIDPGCDASDLCDDQTEPGEQSEQSEQAEHAEQTDQTGQTEQTDREERVQFADR